MAGVLEARRRIAPHLQRTPLRNYPVLDRLVGAEVWVKHENHLPTGAFKVRGGLNLVSQLSPDERRRGVIAASTGNHGQSVAYAARAFGISARICVPENANPVKVASMRDLGAEVIPGGRDFDDARERCEQLAGEHGYRYIHSGDEPLLIEGVGTATLEMFEEQPDLETIVVPVGGGSGASGACIVREALQPSCEVIGVQSEAAPAAYRSWEKGELVEDEMGTAAEGLATRTAFALPQEIMCKLLTDFVLVSEADIVRCTRVMIEATRTLVEGAAASALAGALSLGARLGGRKVAVVCSGGNISPAQLLAVLSGPAPGGPA